MPDDLTVWHDKHESSRKRRGQRWLCLFLCPTGVSTDEVATALDLSLLKTNQRYAPLSQDTLLAAVDAAAKCNGGDLGPKRRKATRSLGS